MSEYERILLECRYLLSLNKTCHELSLIFHTDVETIYNDLTTKLEKLDSILYKRVMCVLKKNN